MDKIDRRILILLAQRQKISSQMGRVKQRGGIPFLQPLRKKVVLQSRTVWASQQGLPGWFVKPLFKLIMKYSLFVQKKAMKESLRGKKSK